MANFFDRYDEGANYFDQFDVEEPRQALPTPRGEMRAVEPTGFEQYVADPARRGAIRFQQALTTALRDEEQPERYAASMARLERARQAYPMAEEQEAGLQAIAESDTLGDFFANVVDNPGAIANVVVESAATFAPALLGTALASSAGPGGTAAAAGLGSGATEYLISMTEAIGEAGGDPRDPRAWLQAVQDEEVVTAARDKGVARGVSIGTIDALTAGLAGRLLAGAGPGIISPVARTAGEVGVQATGGAVGETLAQAAAGEEFKLGEVGLEAIAEIPTAAVEVPANLRYARQAAARNEAEAAQQREDDEAQLLSSMDQMRRNPDDPDVLDTFNTELDYFTSRYGPDAYREVMQAETQRQRAVEMADTAAAEFAALAPDEMAARQQQLPGMEEEAGAVVPDSLAAEAAATRAQFGPGPQQELGLPTPRSMEREELAAEERAMRQETDAIAAQREAEEAQLRAEEAEYARIQRDEDARRRMQQVAPETAQLGLPLDETASQAYQTQRYLETGERPTAEPQLFPEEEVSRVGVPEEPVPETMEEALQLPIIVGLRNQAKGRLKSQMSVYVRNSNKLLRQFNRGNIDVDQLETGLRELWSKVDEQRLPSLEARYEQLYGEVQAQRDLFLELFSQGRLTEGALERALQALRVQGRVYDVVRGEARQPDMFEAERQAEVESLSTTRQIRRELQRRGPSERTTELPETPVPRAAVRGEPVRPTRPYRAEPVQGGGIGVSESVRERLQELPQAEERGYLRPGERATFGPVGTKKRGVTPSVEEEISGRGVAYQRPKKVETEDKGQVPRAAQRRKERAAGKKQLAQQKKAAARGVLPKKELGALERNIRTRHPQWSDERVQQEVEERAAAIVARRKEAAKRKEGSTPATKGEAIRRHTAKRVGRKRDAAVKKTRSNILDITPRLSRPKTADKIFEIAEALRGAKLPQAERVQRIGVAVKNGRMDYMTAEERLMKVYNEVRQQQEAGEFYEEVPREKLPPEARNTRAFLKKETVRRVRSMQNELVESLNEDQRRILEAGTNRDREVNRAEVARGQRRILSPATPPAPSRRLAGVKRAYPTNLSVAQAEGVAWALDALNKPFTRTRPNNFLLADGTGFGKTRQLLAVADQLINEHGGKVLYVHPGEQNGPLVKQAKEDAEALGVQVDGRIDFVSYQTLQRNPSKYADEYTAVLFDEAHQTGNEDTAYASAADQINSPRRMFVSATAGDAGHKLGIFAQLKNKSLEDYLVSIGYKRVPGKKKAIRLVPQEGTTEDEIALRVVRDHKRLTNEGKIVRREFESIADMDVGVAESTPAMVRYAEALNAMDEIPAPLKVKQQAIIAESDKAEATVKEIKAALARGEKAIVMANHHSNINVGPKASPRTVPSVLSQVAAQLRNDGILFVEYHGGQRQTPIEEFQRQQLGPRQTNPDVLLTTFGKGGTGLNLDDVVGDKPRTMIIPQTPWSGIELEQAVGRIDRQTTRSVPKVVVLTSEDHPGDIATMRRQREKQKLMNAVTVGVPYAPEWTQQRTDGYTVEQTEDRNGRPVVKVRLSMPEEDTRAVAELFKQSRGWYNKSTRSWTLTPTAWEAVQPYVDTFVEPNEETILGRPALEETARPEDAGAVEVMQQTLSGPEPSSLTPLLYEVAKQLPDGHPFKQLVNRLAGLGLDVPVYAAEPGQGSQYTVTPGGNRRIDVDTSSLPALLHEGVHAATERALQDRNDPKVQRLNDLFEQARRVIAKRFGTEDIGLENYGITNLDEFVAEALTNPVFQDQLDGIRVDNQTLWRKFLNAIKSLLGMNTVKNTVLDEVLRLAPQVMETEAEVRLNLMLDHSTQARSLQLPVHQRMGGEVADATSKLTAGMRSLKPVASQVLDVMRQVGKLPMMTLRQIEESYGRFFLDGDTNLISRYVNLLGRKERRAREHQRAADFQLRKLTEYRNQDGEKAQELFDLMGAATVYKTHVDAGWNDPANAHLREDAKGNPLPPRVVANNKKNFDQLRRQYLQTDDEGKKLYGDVKQFFEKDWQNTATLLTRNIADSADLPFGNYRWRDIVDKSTAEIRQMVENDLDTYLKGNAGIDEKEQRGMKATARDLAENLGEVARRGKVKGPYFPLRRFGDYVVEARGPERRERFTEYSSLRERKAELESANPYDDVKEIREPDGTYTLVHNNRSVEFFESKRQAELGRQALLDDEDFAAGQVSNVTAREEYMESKGMSGALIERAVDKLGNNKRAAAAMRSAFIQFMPETSVHKALLRRGSVRGFSTDMRRAFAAHAKASSHYLSQLEYGQDLTEAMQAMRSRVSDARFSEGEDQVRMQHVLGELKKRDALDVTEMSTSKILDNASNIGFIWYLLSPSYWAVNATQPHMIATPWLAARSSHVKAQGAMSRAYGAVLPEIMSRGGAVAKAAMTGDVDALGGIADFLTEEGTAGEGFIKRIRENGRYSPKMQNEMIAMLNSLGETGIIDMTFAADLRTAAEGTKAGIIDRTTEWARIMPHLVEVTNRSVTAMAAYELARKQGKGTRTALKFAEQAVASTQFDYGAVNKPRYFSERHSKLVRPVLMFMQHSQHMYYMMLRSMAQSAPAVAKRLRGQSLTEAEKAQARIAGRTFAGVIASHALMAGALGATFEPVKWAIGLAALVFGSDDEPWDFETEVSRFMSDTFGKEVGPVLARGLPAALGVDVSSRINLSNLAFFDRGGGEEGREWLESKAFELLGPLGGMAANMAEAGKNFREGDYNRAMQQVTPKMFRDAIKAYGLNTNGLLDNTGKQVRPAADISPAELFYTSMGFTPVEMSKYYARKNAIKSAEGYYGKQRRRLLERYRRAGPDERKTVWADIRRFNRGAPKSLRLTRASIIKSRKQTRKAERQMRKYGGVYLPETQRELAKYGDF